MHSFSLNSTIISCCILHLPTLKVAVNNMLDARNIASQIANQKILPAGGKSANVDEHFRTETKDGKTAMFFAFRGKNDKIMKRMRAAGAKFSDVEYAQLGKKLWYAAGAGEEAEVKRLVKAGVDTNFESKRYQMTALMVASSQGHDGVVELLILGNANVNKMAAGNKRSALDIAEEEEYSKVSKVLQKYGAGIAYTARAPWQEQLDNSSLSDLVTSPGQKLW